MIFALLFALAAALDYDCDIDNNQPMYFEMNFECNNAGSCVQHQYAQYEPVTTLGVCSCSDPFNADSTVFEDPAWLYGAYSGATCANYVHQLYSVISYVIHVETYNAADPYVGKEGELKCHKGASGQGVIYGDANYLPVPDMTDLVGSVIKEATFWADLQAAGYTDYAGTVVPSSATDSDYHCQICLDAPNDCIAFVGGVQNNWGPEGAGGHLMISFSTDFNTYYDASCAMAGDAMPTTEGQAYGCLANQEKGLSAQKYWTSATQGGDVAAHHATHFLELTQQPTSTPVGSPSYPGLMGFGWSPEISMEYVVIQTTQVAGVLTEALPNPTQSPTPDPTPSPTGTPIADDSCFSYGYTHQIADLVFAGIAEAGDRGCRHGLETGWPGGMTTDMCSSPYVICLPMENTPNVGFPVPGSTADMYLDNSTPYSLDQCKKECAYDQRCTGFEFWSGSNDQTGYCSLIDDIPIEIGTSANNGIASEADLLGQADWSASALGGRICYSKNVACNPYFAEDQLDEVMLNCYCPDNRKGFYTKKVHRTVAASVYCGSDPTGAVTKRIRESQANRMFHLCENWCLFNTQTPRTESWYHDPWQQCWREQYAGVGAHRSYCYRVIRDPMTIEQYFIDTRSANMCTSNTAGDVNSDPPTSSPVANGDVTWRMASEYDSCDDVCADNGMRCSLSDTNMLTTMYASFGNPAGVQAAFLEAGFDCSSTFTDGNLGWAFPGIAADGTCITRNDGNYSADPPLETTCNLSIGDGYRRLCACTSSAT